MILGSIRKGEWWLRGSRWFNVIIIEFKTRSNNRLAPWLAWWLLSLLFGLYTSRMIDRLLNQAAVAVLNRMLGREAWAREKLAPFAGRMGLTGNEPGL